MADVVDLEPYRVARERGVKVRIDADGYHYIEEPGYHGGSIITTFGVKLMPEILASARSVD